MRRRAAQTPEAIGISLWQTFRAVVVSPRQAMADLAVDPRAGWKGLQLLVIVEVANAVIFVVQSQFDRSVSAAWSGPLVMVATVAASAVVLRLASRDGTYASAFGRLSFAFEVPMAVVGLPWAVASTMLLVLGGTLDAEPFASLSLAVTLALFVWALVLVILAIRASVVGCAAVGCTALLIVVAFFVVVLLALAILIATGQVASLPEPTAG